MASIVKFSYQRLRDEAGFGDDQIEASALPPHILHALFLFAMDLHANPFPFAFSMHRNVISNCPYLNRFHRGTLDVNKRLGPFPFPLPPLEETGAESSGFSDLTELLVVLASPLGGGRVSSGCRAFQTVVVTDCKNPLLPKLGPTHVFPINYQFSKALSLLNARIRIGL
ncbi:hypothetical protein U1Q18_041226 [Sarracenia purpurea var. burkii]